MELYAKGQLSFLILTCLLDRDFYGLDIISEISSRSNGKINLKKPSVYSNLTRMEKQGYVSSYLRSSDFGPNRKYYSLTEKGRGFYQELKAYFDYNNIDVFRDFVDVDVQTDNFLNKDYSVTVSENVSEPVKVAYTTEYIHTHPLQQESIDEQVSENVNDVSEDIDSVSKEPDDDFFDFSSLEEGSPSEPTQVENISEANNESENINDESVQEKQLEEVHSVISEIEETFGQTIQITPEELDSYQREVVEENEKAEQENKDDARFLVREESTEEETVQSNTNASVEPKEEVIEPVKDDAKFLPNENVDEYNKRLFDISKDINKIKRRSSFAEDQIAITAAADPLVVSNEKKKANIEEFKNSLLENKNRYAYQSMQYSPRPQPKPAEIKPAVEEKVEKDDAKLITGRITPDDVEKARKIEPPKIKIVSENTKDARLPAPKRDTNVDPSHREILNKLYSKTKDNASAEIRNDAIYDYNDLKDFYEGQSISFDIYHKVKEKKSHNTNLLYLIMSLSILLVSVLTSTILYVILLKTGMTNQHTNFLYILLPSLLIIDVGFKVYNYKVYTSGMPAQLNPQWKMWCYYLLISCIIVGLNLICGLATKEFSLLATTLLLPLVLALIVIPGRYYLKRIVLIKYWK